MAAAMPRAPEDLPLPASESAFIRPDENASHSPERPRCSPINDEDDASYWATVSWKDFLDFTPFYNYLLNYLDPWKKASYLAVQEFPFGGAIVIPLPSSVDDLEATFQSFYEVNRSQNNPQLEMLSRTPLSHCPDQAACNIWAEYAWNRWLEKKPRLMVFDTTGFKNKGTDWDKDDVTEYRGEETVKLWISEHYYNDLVNPALVSAEFHVIFNTIVIFDPPLQLFYAFGDRRSASRRTASALTLQHMGPLKNNGFGNWLKQFPLFFHRINMFTLASQSKRLHATHRRAEGRFPAAKTDMTSSHWFVESCISIVAVFEDARDKNTVRSVFIIKDEYPRSFQDELLKEVFEDKDSTQRAEFLPTLLRRCYLIWEKAWNSCLDGIDDSVKITLEDISDSTRLDTFMFDSANFERSRSYFAALQLLRIFSDRIKETRQDLIQAIKVLGQDESVFKSAELEEAESRLIQRIDGKTEEIKTLRDGLFNSTSVREATRATQMNRYVIVFTVVTVLYTPPSFISALFATPLPYFTKGDPDDFKRAVGIATGTTVLAAIILLVIANSFDNVVRNPKDRLVSMVKSTRTKGRSIVAKSQSFTRVPFQTVQEAVRALRELAGKAVEKVGGVGQRGTQNTAPHESRGQTDQMPRGQDIDLSDRTANVASPPRNDHGGNIV